MRPPGTRARSLLRSPTFVKARTAPFLHTSLGPPSPQPLPICSPHPHTPRSYLGLLEAPGPAVAAWVNTDAFAAQLASHFPASAAPHCADTAAVLAHEYAARTQCHDAFAAVARFEGSHSLQLGSMAGTYLAQVRSTRAALPPRAARSA